MTLQCRERERERLRVCKFFIKQGAVLYLVEYKFPLQIEFALFEKLECSYLKEQQMYFLNMLMWQHFYDVS